MEQWLPFFHHLLSSPANAATFFSSRHHPNSTPPAAAFLRLLLFPTPILLPSSNLPTTTTTIFFQTLPPLLQSQILSFLSSSLPLFDHCLLRSLTAHILLASHNFDFWVARAARHLLDALPNRGIGGFGGVSDTWKESSDGFHDPPPWLLEAAERGPPLLPWLPLDYQSVQGSGVRGFGAVSEGFGLDSLALEQEEALRSPEVEEFPSPAPPLGDSAVESALVLQKEMVAVESVSEAQRVAKDLQKLCVESGNAEMVLSLVQPWEANDDTARVLLSNLVLGEDVMHGKGPALVLCSVVLPKLHGLQRPASSVVLSATLDFCKRHPAAAVDALLFPLVFRKEGLNVPQCDLLTRIIKDCMHPLHVSAFCHRLLSGEEKERMLVCMPQNRENITGILVWTESLFALFYSILNQDVHLTPPTSDRLVSVIDEMASKFSRSLKFGNFVLCFVAKCGRVSKLHKVLLERAAERTDTFVTKAILAKLRGL